MIISLTDIISKNKIVCAIQAFIINRKKMIVAIAVITAIVMVIVGAAIFQAANGYIQDGYMSQADEIHNDHIILNIFKLSVLMLLVFTAGVVCVLLCMNVKLEYVFIAAALCLGSAYVFVMTPISTPDEPHHYHSSYIISGYILFEDDPELGDPRHFDYSMFFVHHNVPSAYLRLINEGVYILDDNIVLRNVPSPYDINYPPTHVPQALGITVARMIGLNFFGVFYEGRLFNLLFYILCVFLSIKWLRGFKLPLFVIGLLPISLHQAASFNYDAFINGVSMMFIAFSISCIYEKDTFRWRNYIPLIILGILLAPVKTVYTPLIFMVFIIALRRREVMKGRIWIATASVVIISALFALLFFLMSDFAISVDNATSTNWEGGYNYTLAYVLSYPLQTIMVFLRTIAVNFKEYFFGAFGRYLSGLTIVIPWPYMLVIIGLVISSIFYGKRNEWQPTIRERVVFLLICATVAGLIMASMFLLFTSDHHNVIIGVQGRYFTPLLPLVLLLLRSNRLLTQCNGYRNAVVIASVLMQCAVIVYILDYTMTGLA